MDRDIDWVLLERYFAGECSPGEVAMVQRWTAADPARERLVAVMRAAWERTGAMPARRDPAAAWTALATRLQERTPAEEAPRTPARPLTLLPVRRPASTIVTAMRIAASVALLVGGALVWRTLDRTRGPSSAAPLQQVATAPGQRAEVSLSDGTHVLLGVASRLRFAPAFGTTREVYLEGEALFDVAHDPTRPFLVHARHATARDIGTRFNVRAYGDAPDVAVLVTEGSVSLTGAAAGAAPAARDSLILRRADLGRIHEGGRLAVAHNADTTNYLAWTRGELVFDRTPVPEAVTQLARWYGVDVRLGDPGLAHHALTTSLGTQPFAEAIGLIATALDARVERRGASYLLFAKHTAR